MERKILMGFVLLLLTASCSQEANPGKENMFKNKTFVHLYFDSEEECMEAQPDPDFWINCHQELNFHDEKEVTIMLTDMLWDGTYEVKADLLILKFGPNPEIPSGEIFFKIINPSQLERVEDKTIWKKVSGDNIWK